MRLKITFWKIVFAVIVALGIYGVVLRFTQGLGAATNLSDEFPWGLWIGFDLLCGVGLAAGGFTMAAVVHVFNVKRYHSVVRPAILTAFLGYVLVILALLVDLGRPWFIWHPIIMWNHHSVMFEVAWCVMLYTTVLAVEFSPAVLERFKLRRLLGIVRRSLPFFVVAGVLLSTLHQSSLGSLYLIVPNKLHPLWYSPLLPVLFWLSAVTVGCAMVILESFLSQQAFGHALPRHVREGLASMALVLLIPYALLRILDLLQRGALSLAFRPGLEGAMFLLEVGLGVLLPLALLLSSRVRASAPGQLGGAVLIILGFVLNRMNVGITGMEATIRAGYFPAWTEVAVTMMIVALGFAGFSLAARHLPVFEHQAADDLVEVRKEAKAKERWEGRGADLPTGYPSP